MFSSWFIASGALLFGGLALVAISLLTRGWRRTFVDTKGLIRRRWMDSDGTEQIEAEYIGPDGRPRLHESTAEERPGQVGETIDLRYDARSPSKAMFLGERPPWPRWRAGLLIAGFAAFFVAAFFAFGGFLAYATRDMSRFVDALARHDVAGAYAMLDPAVQQDTSLAAFGRWAEDASLSELSFVHSYCSDSTGAHLEGWAHSHQHRVDVEVWWTSEGIVAVRVEKGRGLGVVPPWAECSDGD